MLSVRKGGRWKTGEIFLRSWCQKVAQGVDGGKGIILDSIYIKFSKKGFRTNFGMRFSASSIYESSGCCNHCIITNLYSDKRFLGEIYMALTASCRQVFGWSGDRSITLPIWTLKMSGSMTRYI